MGVDAAVWASVRFAHDDGSESVARFCDRLGVSRSAYYRRRRRENWPPRPVQTNQDAGNRLNLVESVSSPNESGPLSAPPSKSHAATDQTVQRNSPEPDTGTRKHASRKRLIKRLYAAIDHELGRLEAGPFAEAGASVPEIERTTRTLMNMIRSLEKVLELETDKQNRSKRKRRAGDACASGRGVSSGQDGARDAERMRQDIAERLGRLHAQWSSGSRS